MIDFSHITLSGFFNVPEQDPVEVLLDQAGLNLVLGENGAGKSSRYTEGIYWCLYGKTLRELKGADGVINKDSEMAHVSLILTMEGGCYQVIRTKSRGRSQTLEVERIDGATHVPILPAANLAEKQTKLEEWLGLDANTFSNSVVFGQGATALFASGLSDAERKSVFDRLCGLGEYDQAAEVAQSHRKAAEVEATVRQTRLEDAQARLKSLHEELGEVEDRRVTLAQEIELARDTLAVQIEETQRELEEAERNLVDSGKAVMDAKAARDALPPASGDPETIKDRAEAVAMGKDCAERKTALEKALRVLRGTVEGGKLEAKKLQESLTTSKCAYCGSVLSNVETVTSALRDRSSEIETGEASIRVIEGKLGELTVEANEVGDLLRQLNEAVLGASSNRRRADEQVAEKAATLSALRLVVETKTKHLTALGGMSEALQARWNEAEKSLADLKSEILTKADEIAGFQKARDEAHEKLAIFQFWVDAFGPRGIKAFLIENVLPRLNRLINEHLGYLSDGEITAKVTATTSLKKGGVAERLAVEIVNSSGAELYGGNSGGEKRRIDLAILLALQDLVGSRASRGVNLAIYDEVLDALDEDGTTKAVNYLKIRSVGKPTYLISHSEHTKALVEDLIRV